MNESWRWERRGEPFPARRLVIDPQVRQQIHQFLEYRSCPKRLGDAKTHRFINFVHAIDGANGALLCITVGDLRSLERRRGTEVITESSGIPSDEWQVLGAWGYV